MNQIDTENGIPFMGSRPSALQALKDLIEKNYEGDAAPLLTAVDGFKLGVRYVIITHKDTNEKSENLPLFSRISLMRSLRALRAMGVKATVCYVKDSSAAKAGKKKTRKKKQDEPVAD